MKVMVEQRHPLIFKDGHGFSAPIICPTNGSGLRVTIGASSLAALRIPDFNKGPCLKSSVTHSFVKAADVADSASALQRALERTPMGCKWLYQHLPPLEPKSTSPARGTPC